MNLFRLRAPLAVVLECSGTSERGESGVFWCFFFKGFIYFKIHNHISDCIQKTKSFQITYPKCRNFNMARRGFSCSSVVVSKQLLKSWVRADVVSVGNNLTPRHLWADIPRTLDPLELFSRMLLEVFTFWFTSLGNLLILSLKLSSNTCPKALQPNWMVPWAACRVTPAILCVKWESSHRQVRTHSSFGFSALSRTVCRKRDLLFFFTLK